MSAGLTIIGSDANNVASRPSATMRFFVSAWAASGPKGWGGSFGFGLAAVGVVGGASAAVAERTQPMKIDAKVASFQELGIMFRGYFFWRFGSRFSFNSSGVIAHSTPFAGTSALAIQ